MTKLLTIAALMVLFAVPATAADKWQLYRHKTVDSEFGKYTSKRAISFPVSYIECARERRIQQDIIWRLSFQAQWNILMSYLQKDIEIPDQIITRYDRTYYVCEPE